MITGELRNKIDGIWDIFWSSGMTNPLTVIEQITYLMFIKILDDRELQRESDCTGAEPVFGPDQQDCRWHNFRRFDADAMFSNMTQKVFPFIRSGLRAGPGTVLAEYMKDALFLVPSARVLVRVVDALDGLDFGSRDIMGDVYEYLLSQIARSGTNGQFRTPRHIIRMMVELTEPVPEDTICDPAMGSAGFLCAAARYVSEHYAEALRNPENKKHYLTDMFTGFDTDRTMLRIGAMNMMLHGVEAPRIARMDSLSRDNSHRGEYSLILANPPFTGSLDRETVSEDLLAPVATGKTELLFLNLFQKALKPGGRCACIVPDGVLFGSSKAHRAVRRELVENNRLEAVISMPSGVFRPYAGISTAVLIFTKAGSTDRVWFYDMTADGFSLDDRRSPAEASDIPDIIARFRNPAGEENRQRTEKSFFVPLAEIAENDYSLSMGKYKEIEYIPVNYPPVPELMTEIHELQAKISADLADLDKIM